jgi:SAM-dependent methyltransferase
MQGGAALSALEYFGPFSKIRYIGCDVSEAVWVAAKRVHEQEGDVTNSVFMHEDITQLPFAPESVDCIFSEGVLHHTDSTQGALASLVPLLKPGGYFLFYVYNKKGPVREFTDDCIREKLQAMSSEEAWKALQPLTELGIQLGNIDAEIDLKDGFPLLDIPAGKLSLQRFFYWHVCKAFYRSDLTFEEMHHINFDWFAPKNAFRQTPDEVESWCVELGLDIVRLHVENAGITVVARKR